MVNAVTFGRTAPAKKKYVQFIARIKQMILSGRLKPGDRLPTESQLSEQLGISRTPVREAIKILESMGVVTIKRGEGMFLQRPLAGTEINPLVFDLLMLSNETERLIEFRQYFEHMVIELAVNNKQAGDCERLRDHLDLQREAMDGAADATWTELDIGFHLKILEMTRNPFMIDIGMTVYELYRNLKPRLSGPEDRTNTIQTHHLYLEIICSPKPELFDELRKKISSNYAALKLK